MPAVVEVEAIDVRTSRSPDGGVHTPQVNLKISGERRLTIDLKPWPGLSRCFITVDGPRYGGGSRQQTCLQMELSDFMSWCSKVIEVGKALIEKEER